MTKIFNIDGELTRDNYVFKVYVVSNVDNPGAKVKLTWDTDDFTLNLDESQIPTGVYDSENKVWLFDALANQSAVAFFSFDFDEPTVNDKRYTFSAEVTGLDTSDTNNKFEEVVTYKKENLISTGNTNPTLTASRSINVSENDSSCTGGDSKWVLNEDSLTNGIVQEWNESTGKGEFTAIDPTLPITGTYTLTCHFGDKVLSNPEESFTIYPQFQEFKSADHTIGWEHVNSMNIEDKKLILAGDENNIENFPTRDTRKWSMLDLKSSNKYIYTIRNSEGKLTSYVVPRAKAEVIVKDISLYKYNPETSFYPLPINSYKDGTIIFANYKEDFVVFEKQSNELEVRSVIPKKSPVSTLYKTTNCVDYTTFPYEGYENEKFDLEKDTIIIVNDECNYIHHYRVEEDKSLTRILTQDKEQTYITRLHGNDGSSSVWYDHKKNKLLGANDSYGINDNWNERSGVRILKPIADNNIYNDLFNTHPYNNFGRKWGYDELQDIKFVTKLYTSPSFDLEEYDKVQIEVSISNRQHDLPKHIDKLIHPESDDYKDKLIYIDKKQLTYTKPPMPPGASPRPPKYMRAHPFIAFWENNLPEDDDKEILQRFFKFEKLMSDDFPPLPNEKLSNMWKMEPETPNPNAIFHSLLITHPADWEFNINIKPFKFRSIIEEPYIVEDRKNDTYLNSYRIKDFRTTWRKAIPLISFISKF